MNIPDVPVATNVEGPSYVSVQPAIQKEKGNTLPAVRISLFFFLTLYAALPSSLYFGNHLSEAIDNYTLSPVGDGDKFPLFPHPPFLLHLPFYSLIL